MIKTKQLDRTQKELGIVFFLAQSNCMTKLHHV